MTPRSALPVLVGATALLFALHLSLGSKHLALGTVMQALLVPKAESFDHRIVLDLRLTLAMAAVLAVAGTVMQGLTRNPLADPCLLGLS